MRIFDDAPDSVHAVDADEFAAAMSKWHPRGDGLEVLVMTGIGSVTREWRGGHVYTTIVEAPTLEAAALVATEIVQADIRTSEPEVFTLRPDYWRTRFGR